MKKLHSELCKLPCRSVGKKPRKSSVISFKLFKIYQNFEQNQYSEKNWKNDVMRIVVLKQNQYITTLNFRFI